MVTGVDGFKRWFEGFEEQYVIIGGTACDIYMESFGEDFRATKDLDLVLIVEALTPEFARRFWDYVKAAGYEHRNKSAGNMQFYRFYGPAQSGYPLMIELFSRKPDVLILPEEAILTPIPIDDAVSSLSAILLDDAYYKFMRNGTVLMDGLPILDPSYIIPFKAKAWLDLTERRKSGEHVDSKDINKHKRDILRLMNLIPQNIRVKVSVEIKNDMDVFIDAMRQENINLKQLGVVGRTMEEILADMSSMYVL